MRRVQSRPSPKGLFFSPLKHDLAKNEESDKIEVVIESFREKTNSRSSMGEQFRSFCYGKNNVQLIIVNGVRRKEQETRTRLVGGSL